MTTDRQREKKVGFLARISHSRPACSHVHPMLKELEFLIPSKSGTAVGAFAGLILFVALSSGVLLLKLRNKRISELYKASVMEGQLEEEAVG